MRPDQLNQAAADFGISQQSAHRMRIRYLLEVMDQWERYIAGGTDDMPPSTTVDCLNEIIRLKNSERRQRRGQKTQEITDEMVESARNYPIEQVVEFNKGVAIAFCHADSRPSLSWNRKNNTAHCFPCGKSFNALDVLIDRDGKDFITAVKELC